jgi:hypothetical protein
MRAGIAIVSAVAIMTARMPAGLALNAASAAPQSVPFDSAQVVSISPSESTLDLRSTAVSIRKT